MPFYPIFSGPLYTTLFLGAILVLVLLILEKLVYRGTLSGTASRRLVHLLAGGILFSCRFVFEDAVYPIAMASLFLALNLTAIKLRKMASIHSIDRKSYGTVWFPLAYVLLAALFWERHPAALQTGILLLAIADPLAGWVGEYLERPKFVLWSDSKTIPGAMTMLAASAVIVALGIGFLIPLAGLPAWTTAQFALGVPLAAVVATIAEVHSRNGSDNLSVPLAGALFIALFTALPADQIVVLTLWSGASAVILAGAVWLPALDISGMLSAWLMGLFIFLAGGWTWLLPIILFFMASSLLTLLHRTEPSHAHQRRDVRQVFANGGVPLGVAILYGLSGWGELYVVYLATLAAATADTWATEIGSWSRSAPRSIVGWKIVPMGTSGGITLLGTVGSLAGAAVIAGAGLALVPDLIQGTRLLVIIIVGFGAALVDSLLGATLQVRFRGPGGKVTEDRETGQAGTVISGWPWLDNNMVNAVHAALAAAAATIWITTA